MLKKAKSGESLAKARFDIDGQIILLLGRSGERRIEPSGSWFPLKFPSFSGKSGLICRTENALFSNFSQTSNGHDPVLTSFEPLEQVITPRGPFVVNIKIWAVKDEPNMALRCCSR